MTELVQDTAGVATTYSDATTETGGTYVYAVTALSLDGDSPRSTTMSITRAAAGTTTRDAPPEEEEELIAQQQQSSPEVILISTHTGAYLPGNHSIELLEDATGTQFTTGDDQHGYLLTKVTHRIHLDSPGIETVGATVNADNAGSPSTELYTFPDQTITNTNLQAVTHVGEFLLEPNRKYWILITKGAGSITSLQVYFKQSNDVATGLADWTLSSGSTYYFEGAWHNYSNSYSIRLEGVVRPVH